MSTNSKDRKTTEKRKGISTWDLYRALLYAMVTALFFALIIMVIIIAVEVLLNLNVGRDLVWILIIDLTILNVLFIAIIVLNEIPGILDLMRKKLSKNKKRRNKRKWVK